MIKTPKLNWQSWSSILVYGLTIMLILIFLLLLLFPTLFTNQEKEATSQSSSVTREADVPTSESTIESSSYPKTNFLSADEAIKIAENYYKNQGNAKNIELTFEAPTPSTAIIINGGKFLHILGYDTSHTPYASYTVNIETGEIMEAPINFDVPGTEFVQIVEAQQLPQNSDTEKPAKEIDTLSAIQKQLIGKSYTITPSLYDGVGIEQAVADGNTPRAFIHDGWQRITFNDESNATIELLGNYRPNREVNYTITDNALTIGQHIIPYTYSNNTVTFSNWTTDIDGHTITWVIAPA